MANSWTTVKPEARTGRPEPQVSGPPSGADDGIRTRDPHLGKVVLYQLSHVRAEPSLPTSPPRLRPDRGGLPALDRERMGGLHAGQLVSVSEARPEEGGIRAGRGGLRSRYRELRGCGGEHPG